jgi:hypothetical protein
MHYKHGRSFDCGKPERFLAAAGLRVVAGGLDPLLRVI